MAGIGVHDSGTGVHDQPALDGVVEKMEAGARVADVGCGHGASTILMARTYPRSEFVGIDYHDASIEAVRKRAAEAGAGNTRFEVADATSYGGDDYDLIAFFDCLTTWQTRLASPGMPNKH